LQLDLLAGRHSEHRMTSYQTSQLSAANICGIWTAGSRSLFHRRTREFDDLLITAPHDLVVSGGCSRSLLHRLGAASIGKAGTRWLHNVAQK
jgi:hypothetical protein